MPFRYFKGPFKNIWNRQAVKTGSVSTLGMRKVHHFLWEKYQRVFFSVWQQGKCFNFRADVEHPPGGL